MKKKFIVYMHITPSNKRYIGITSNEYKRRWQNGYGYRGNKHFFNAIKKYGWENIKHEILFENLTQKEACKIETELIAKYKSDLCKYGYNKSIGGENPNVGGRISEQTKRKISKSLKGYKHTQETREKDRQAKLGTHLSAETKNKISEAKKGAKNAMYGKSTSAKQKEAVKKACSKPVKCVETNKKYPSIIEAERQTGICDSSIQAVCKGKRKTAGGFSWEYCEVV